MKALEHFLKLLWLDSLVFLKYGTRSPSRVSLPRSQHSVFVDPSDLRARKKLIRESVRGRLQRNAQFWRRACEQLRPSVVLDVGLNYGECLFSCDYPPQTRLIGIEANAGLQPFVDRSRAVHPNSEQIEIYFALASDVHQQASNFYVMQNWSGGSTALADATDVAGAEYERVEIQSVQIDHLLASTIESDQLLLFKIDVEGFEPSVLRGMQQSIQTVATAIGFLEFDTKLLDRTADNAVSFWTELQRQFRVYAFTSHRTMTDVTGWSLAEAKKLFGSDGFHTDLLLVNSIESDKIDRFLSQWLTVTFQPTERRAAA